MVSLSNHIRFAAAGGLEGFEIMPARERFGGTPHRSDIQRIGKTGGEMPYERIGETRGRHGIAVPLRPCRALGIKFEGSGFRGYYQNILGKRTVESVFYLIQGKL